MWCLIGVFKKPFACEHETCFMRNPFYDWLFVLFRNLNMSHLNLRFEVKNPKKTWWKVWMFHALCERWLDWRYILLKGIINVHIFYYLLTQPFETTIFSLLHAALFPFLLLSFGLLNQYKNFIADISMAWVVGENEHCMFIHYT